MVTSRWLLQDLAHEQEAIKHIESGVNNHHAAQQAVFKVIRMMLSLRHHSLH